jgi:serine/threonine-protein kinase RsbW
MSELPAPREQVVAHLHVEHVPHDGRVLAALVEAVTPDLGLTTPQAAHLGEAAGAVGRAVHRRGFDDPAAAALDVEVARVGHRVVVRIDDLGLPFDYDDAEQLDGAVIRRALGAGWLDEVHHSWRGRSGNRTELVRHVDPGTDLRGGPPPDEHLIDPPAAAADVAATTRLGTPDDTDAICRLVWRTYGPTYQHEEYYQPERLAAMLEHGTQTSFVTEVDGDIVGHSALLVDEPGAVVVEGGRAMVDPRYRGHHLYRRPRTLREQWCREHGVIALVGVAVTAHTRSQSERPITSVQLGFLPPVRFEGIDGSATPLREAVVGSFVPMAEIPGQTVHLPRRDAAVVAPLYERSRLDRTVDSAPAAPPAEPTSVVEVSAHADLGHAVLRVRRVGADLDAALRGRLASVAAGGTEVTYVDLRVDDPAISWAADVAVDAGAVLAGVLPLEARGVDLVRYQILGDTPVDPGAIHLKTDDARELLDYVLSQRGGGP